MDRKFESGLTDAETQQGKITTQNGEVSNVPIERQYAISKKRAVKLKNI